MVQTAVANGADAAALGFGLIVVLGFDQGGYFPDSWRWASVGFAAVAAIALLVRRRVRLGPLERVSFGALVALALWMLLSGWWGVAGTEATLEAKRCVVYVTALAALLAVSRRTTVSALLHGVLAGLVLLCGFALADRLVTGPTPDHFEGTLLVGPVGYANALGLLAALGLVLAIGLAWSRRTTILRGASLAGASSICVVALVLTSSRGAWLAALVGASVLVLLRPETAWLLSGPRLVAGAGVLGVVLTAAVATHASASLGDRPAYWRVAVEDASQHPLLGSGAGSFADVWLERRPLAVDVRDAHSLYLETLAELGVVGSILVLGVFVPPIVASVGRRADPTVAAAVAGLAVYLVHAGLDWDWEMPVTTLAGLACAAALLVAARPDPSGSPTRP